MKKQTQLLKNEKGSILQIVLVLFLVMSFSLTVGLTLFGFQKRTNQKIDVMMKQKNLEILLIQQYVKDIQDGFIFRSSYEKDDIFVENQIDDMADYYLITTRVKEKNMQYSFIVEIEKETGKFKKLQYER